MIPTSKVDYLDQCEYQLWYPSYLKSDMVLELVFCDKHFPDICLLHHEVLLRLAQPQVVVQCLLQRYLVTFILHFFLYFHTELFHQVQMQNDMSRIRFIILS